MKRDRKTRVHTSWLEGRVLLILTVFSPVTPALAQDLGSDSTDLEYRTRGPVHEAFAQPVTFDPIPGEVVSKEPPAPIEEVPPEYKPEGENVIWVPGYWAWDESTSEFLWISGFWRNSPPDRSWVPGYWVATDQGYEWIAGYWQTADAAEVEYLPTPPSTLEEGPSSPAPSEDWVWAPGNWVWAGESYAWQPGYWVEPRPQWIWVPSHYVWTPYGCVFVQGYWDYEVVERGVLFAPVHFPPDWSARPAYPYTPTVVINLTHFTDHLFCHGGYRRYYFGDYYDAWRLRLGFYPWFEFHLGRHGYDPIFCHRRSHHRRGRHHRWERDLRADYELRRKEKEKRPPWTLAGSDGDIREPSERRGRGRRLGHKLDEIVEDPSLNEGLGKLRKLENEERNRWVDRAKATKQLHTKRLTTDLEKEKKGPRQGTVKVKKEGPGAPIVSFQKPSAEDPRKAPPKLRTPGKNGLSAPPKVTTPKLEQARPAKPTSKDPPEAPRLGPGTNPRRLSTDTPKSKVKVEPEPKVVAPKPEVVQPAKEISKGPQIGPALKPGPNPRVRSDSGSTPKVKREPGPRAAVPKPSVTLPDKAAQKIQPQAPKVQKVVPAPNSGSQLGGKAPAAVHLSPQKGQGRGTPKVETHGRDSGGGNRGGRGNPRNQ